MLRCVPPLLFAICSFARPLAGQTQVSGIRDLNFGVVVAGVPSQVLPSDPVKSGKFYIKYVTGGKIKVTFSLPSSLSRVGGGGSMPIAFKSGDAFILGTAPGSVPNPFNPNGASVSHLLAGAPDANVFLGGRVSPAAGTATGSYSAPVVMTVVFF